MRGFATRYRAGAGVRAVVVAAMMLVAPTAGYAQLENESRVDAICKASSDIKLPATDSAGAAPAGCNAVALYDGVGGKPDYRAARACALNALANPETLDDVSGSNAGTLAMIYANGEGTPRDYDLAIAYACLMGGARYELTGRVLHLLDLKENGAGQTRFDYCDDITSGMMQGFCAGRAFAKANAVRDAELARLVDGLSGKKREMYPKLDRAHAGYLEAIEENEVDVSGTGRAAFIIEARTAELERFLELFKANSSGAGKKSAQGFPDADARLNAAYSKLMAIKNFEGGTVTLDGIRATQRKWIAYRDAFIAFAGERADGPIATVLTEDRTQALETFLPSDQ